MTMPALPQAVWEGTFEVFGVTVKCAVLEGGQRVIEAESMEKLFAALEADQHTDMTELAALTEWSMGGPTT